MKHVPIPERQRRISEGLRLAWIRRKAAMNHNSTGPQGFPTELCQHCGLIHAGVCAKIKSIEYFDNGTIKRIEYHDPTPSYTYLTPIKGMTNQ